MENLTGSLFRKKYIQAMKETECGWKPSRNFPDVGCPSDLHFVSMKDEPYKGHCMCSCEECWEYVLKNKQW